jgi:hypothetical protein
MVNEGKWIERVGAACIRKQGSVMRGVKMRRGRRIIRCIGSCTVSIRTLWGGGSRGGV